MVHRFVKDLALGTAGAVTLAVVSHRMMAQQEPPPLTPNTTVPGLAEAVLPKMPTNQPNASVSSPVSAPLPGTPPTGEVGSWITVLPGDTLSEIAKEFYGDGAHWVVIRNSSANRDTLKGANRDIITVGERLWLPGATVGGGVETQPICARTLKQVFPWAREEDRTRHTALIVDALNAEGIRRKDLVCYAIATVAAENTTCRPRTEKPSELSRRPGGRNFSAYVGRLGNEDLADAQRFRGRGFIQITGRSNYELYDRRLGLDGKLIANPDLANDPAIAARILAAYLADNNSDISRALARNDLRSARQVVNGGTHGLDRFVESYELLRTSYE
jgi:putative chitinase